MTMEFPDVQIAYRDIRDRGHQPTHVYMSSETLDAVRDVNRWFYDDNSLEEDTFYGLIITELPSMPDDRIMILDQRIDPRIAPGSVEMVYLDED